MEGKDITLRVCTRCVSSPFLHALEQMVADQQLDAVIIKAGCLGKCSFKERVDLTINGFPTVMYGLTGKVPHTHSHDRRERVLLYKIKCYTT